MPGVFSVFAFLSKFFAFLKLLNEKIKRIKATSTNFTMDWVIPQAKFVYTPDEKEKKSKTWRYGIEFPVRVACEDGVSGSANLGIGEEQHG